MAFSLRRRGALVLLPLLLVIGGCATKPITTTSAAAPVTGPVTAKLASDDPVALSPAPVPRLPVTVASADGRQVTVTDISRIVAFDRYGTFGTTVFALGLGSHLVARDIATKFPAVQHLPVLNPTGAGVDAEAVLALHPTVVLTDNSMTDGTIAQLVSSGVPVVTFDASRSVANAEPIIRAVATALGVPDAGRTLADRDAADIARAKALVPPGSPRLKAAFLYARGTGLMLLGGPGSGADSLLALLGMRDAGTAAGLTIPFTPITPEGMLNAAPDVLLMMTDGLASVGGVDGLLQVPGIADTPAGRARRVVDMDDGVLLSFGPRTGPVALALATALYGTR